jgi:hypothetical protein
MGVAPARCSAPDQSSRHAMRLRRESITSMRAVTKACVERTTHNEPSLICVGDDTSESEKGMHGQQFFATTASTALAGSAFATPLSACGEATDSAYGNAQLGVTLVTFLGGKFGDWRVQSISAYVGETLPSVERVEVRAEISGPADEAVWALHGAAGHARYVDRREKGSLDAAGPPLARPEAKFAALIPIRKNAQWWGLPQDERRAIFEERSHHIADSMKYMPRIARKLYHARDLGEPFDFLTWFEFAPEHAVAFDELLVMLRSREEWKYVDREVEIRLER